MKHGDVREDGMVCWSPSGKNGKGQWVTKAAFERNKEAARQRSKDRVAELKVDPVKREAWNARVLAYHRSDYRRGMFTRTRKRAMELGIPFELKSMHDIPYATHCPVFGVELVQNGRGDFSPSLDKIRPELGYVKGNVIVVSDLANRIKSNATPEQIMAVAKFYKRLT